MIDNHSHVWRNVGPGPAVTHVYVCVCNGVTERDIRHAAAAGCRSMTELTMRTGCGASCGSCVAYATALVDEEAQACAQKASAAGRDYQAIPNAA